MNINLDKVKKNFWFVDDEGNEVTEDDPSASHYYSCFPCQLVENYDSYAYHPTNPIMKFLLRRLCKFSSLYKFLTKNKKKTFRHSFTVNTTWTGSQDVVLAMANSGDYTLEEAIYVYAKSCERCMNVLAYKYLDGKDGYPEYSEEWKKCGTLCEFCGGEENG